MEIVLARHGRPKLHQREWVTPHQLADWIRAYDASGVFVEEAPPSVVEKAARCGWMVSSPLPRCVQSAAALASSQKTNSEEVFREAGLPHTQWRFPRLPASVWTAIFRLAWFCGYSDRSEPVSFARSRASTAAARLIRLAGEHQSVMLLGHGIMMSLVARELTAQGWEGPKRPAYGFWQFNTYTK